METPSLSAEGQLAHTLVKAAVRAGTLVRPARCEQCGKVQRGLHGHHEDYGKPLEVIWLCNTCHLLRHGNHRLPRASDPSVTTKHLQYGTRECQCGGCGLYFSSPATFDKHRDGDMDYRVCLSVRAMRAKGMGQDGKGRWGLVAEGGGAGQVPGE
jgi:hypothetical protein